MKSTSILRAAVLSGLMLTGGAYAAEMTLYTGPQFRGSDLTLHGAADNLERSGFNDRAESLVVRSGRWEVCSDSDFRGYCTVLEPGDYALLNGPLYRRISSAREIAPLAAYNDRRYYSERPVVVDRYPAAADRYPAAVDRYPAVVDRHPAVVDRHPVIVDRYPVTEERGRYSALEMYTLPGFRGSTMKFDARATSLDKRATDEGLGSLVIREGTWEICTGLNYSGTCRVYEPGRYPNLGSFEGAYVGSMRRVG